MRCAVVLVQHLLAVKDNKHDGVVAPLPTVFEAGVWDPLIIAVRAAPHLGAFIAGQPQWRAWLQRLLTASRDASLAASIGILVPREARGKAELTPRETEVHALLAQGLTNVEIANLLFISLSTT